MTQGRAMRGVIEALVQVLPQAAGREWASQRILRIFPGNRDVAIGGYSHRSFWRIDCKAEVAVNSVAMRNGPWKEGLVGGRW